MMHFRPSNFLLVVCALILIFCERTHSQRNFLGKFKPPGNGNNNSNGPPAVCNHDSLIIYQDCRMCVCPRPNRVAKCFKKTCDLRTKDSGQCPPASLKIEDGNDCSIRQSKGCKVDDDCPGAQLCCYDFCGSPRCTNPVPLDATTGTTAHGGRGYQ